MSDEKLNALCDQLADSQFLISADFSSPRSPEKGLRATIRPILIKGELFYQITEIKGQQAWHRNVSPTEFQGLIREFLLNFRQAFLYTKDADFQILVSKKLHMTILKKPPTKASSPTSLSLLHNRQKQYLLKEGTPIPFLIALDVMSAEGKVYPKKQDKFRQVNRFLEMIEDVLPHFQHKRKIHLIDFGCGKAYLTFALYHYLKIIKGYELRLVGIDLKQDVIEKCQALAQSLGYTDLQFICGDIGSYHNTDPVDIVVSLHACDTATDAALEKAVRWKSEAILCVPCCQHELFNQVRNDVLDPLLKHGILKDRFAALATDAARAQLLEVLGYQTQLLEFIDLEHTPKNLLIRAVKKHKAQFSEEAWQSYLKFKQHLHIDPSLERRFQQELLGRSIL